ncbi:MAG: hypothetical protein K0U24_08695 [Gammaproteobacteria bacterium]|nr:hypothetical protein [Gammaproteobacteria bacterium]MCH9764280.1 hypothetical protein [Gammaproteobacteria bacterium]
MNRTNHTDALEQPAPLTRKVYEAPSVTRLDEVEPETGTFDRFNENTTGMLQS